MAKVQSIIKLSGTIGGITHVNSKAYKPHARAKRGTYTPITLADGMKTSSNKQSEANLMAKIIFDGVNEFAPGFKNGQFWSRLVSVFRQQTKAGEDYNYAGFNGMEMRLDYPTSKQGRFLLFGNKNDGANGAVKLNYYLNHTTGYRLSILRIAADETLLIPFSMERLDIEIKEGEKSGDSNFEFTTLPEGTTALYVLQCDQLKEGKSTGLLKGKSVVFLKAS